MKKILFLLGLLAMSFSGFAQGVSQRVDTLYYDGEWKGVSIKAFADYYRVALYPGDSNAKKIFRDFYMDGALKKKGAFISIDAANDSNSVFDGIVESYYRNGKIESHITLDKGVLNGKFIQYYENGLVKQSATYKDGRLTGLLTLFNEDGSYVQEEYEEGNPLHEYYVLCNPDGTLVKLRHSDSSLYWESPTPDECKTIYRDGTPWLVYSKNGVTIAETCTTVKDYGNWHKFDIVISNDSSIPIEIDPDDCLTAFSLNANYKPTTLEVLSSDSYIKKVKRGQFWEGVAMAFAEGLSAAGAGLSSSYSISNTSYSDGSYSTTHTSTLSYDAASSYQSQVLSQQRMADFNYSQWLERQAKEVGYLKKNTVNPGESISGYVNVQRIKGEAVFNTFNINDANYQFAWTYGKDSSFEIKEDVDYFAEYANSQMDYLDSLLISGKRRKFSTELRKFYNWFSDNDVYDEKTVIRLINLEKKSLHDLYDEIEKSLAADKNYDTEYLRKDLLDMYRSLPIPLEDEGGKVAYYTSGVGYYLKR